MILHDIMVWIMIADRPHTVLCAFEAMETGAFYDIRKHIKNNILACRMIILCYIFNGLQILILSVFL